MSARERAEELLVAELTAMLAHDAAKYPQPTGDKKADKAAAKAAASGEGVPPMAPLDDGALSAARALLDAEAAYVRHAMGHAAAAPSAYAEAAATLSRDFVYVPSKRRYERAASVTNTDRLDAVRAEYDAARREMEREARRAAKVEAKALVLIGGLVKRDAAGRAMLSELSEQVAAARIELECFRALQAREVVAAPERIEAALALTEQQREREAVLQERYKGLNRELRGLSAAASAAAKPQAVG
eukprot:354986-Chlamydomonas_euryale.AAC.1